MMRQCSLCYQEALFLNKHGVCDRCEAILADKKIDKAKAIWLRDGKRCRYCGKKLTLKESTQDHIYPKSKGGNNHFKNLACACVKCNREKRNLTVKQAKMDMMEIPENYFRR